MTLIVYDSTVAQKSDKFLLKIAFAVMLFLVLNIFFYNLNLRRTDAECSLPFLPRKAISYPPGRASFELLNGVGQGTSRRQIK